jgi:hypothetical protein
MRMKRVFGLSALALAIGVIAAPGVQAQTSSSMLVCRDGQVTSTQSGACDRHGGIDQQATVRARQGAVNGTTGSNRGIYNGSTNGSVNGQRGIYNGGTVNGGTVNGSNRQIYGNVNNGNAQAHHDNGKHKGWKKKHHKNTKDERENDRRGDGDRDR